MSNNHSQHEYMPVAPYRGKVHPTDTSELFKRPNDDDICELAEQMREATHILSSVLLKEAEAKGSREITPELVEKFSILCHDAVALLDDFRALSQSFAKLLEVVLNSDHLHQDTYATTEAFASSLRSKTDSLSQRIAKLARQYEYIDSRCRKLKQGTPSYRHPNQRDVDHASGVFDRLDAFWRVVSTQLLSMLEGRSALPSGDASRAALKSWRVYEGSLLAAIEALNDCSDALNATTIERAAQEQKERRLRRGFLSFWIRLMGGVCD